MRGWRVTISDSGFLVNQRKTLEDGRTARGRGDATAQNGFTRDWQIGGDTSLSFRQYFYIASIFQANQGTVEGLISY